MAQHQHARRAAGLLAAARGRISLLTGIAVAALAVPGLAVGGLGAAPAAAAAHTAGGCQLGNGVKHVVEITFDNVHFFRDNPNVPSDLQLMPHLLQFLEDNGTMLSNNHTPLIAHTGNNILTTYTGLYGDRAGMPISNSYRTFNPDGTTDPAGSFAYWTDPVFDTAATPSPGHDTNPSMVYSPVPPAKAQHPPAPNTITPAPWVPFTQAGCDVGGTATANTILENTAVDIPKVFGPNSPEAQQLAADSDSFKDAEVADYVGIGVHCAQGSAFCADAQGVKFGQSTPSPTAVSDLLPDEPGGYQDYQALFGHRYVAPQLGAGTPNVSRNGYQVTNAAGNLVDENGNQINGAFLTNQAGFPGFSTINASQTLAYMADMQDDYEHDGRVISEIVTHPDAALSAHGVTALGACYKQLNSSVGEFGTATMQAATAAIESNSPGDASYLHTRKVLAALGRARDRLAGQIKGELDAAAFANAPVHGAAGLTVACRALIGAAEHLASGG
jgi:hypothetical protein